MTSKKKPQAKKKPKIAAKKPTVIEFYDPRKENGWLSNFYAAPITHEGKTYKTSEHLYQALKCSNGDAKRAVRRAATPKDAKEIAHLRADNLPLEQKTSNMELAISLKFDQHADLREKLLKTSLPIVECSPTDELWGNANNGKNLMGRLLMDLRSKISEPKEIEIILEEVEKVVSETNLIIDHLDSIDGDNTDITLREE